MLVIRDYQLSDADTINALAVEAFEPFQEAYTDWPGLRAKLATMSTLATSGEIIVAQWQGQLAGAVAYIGPNAPKAEFFQAKWPIMRMLVVAPTFRGHGIGRALAQECIRRAQRDRASVFALHTSPIMRIALPMYERIGFKWFAHAPCIHGVEYGVYLKEL